MAEALRLSDEERAALAGELIQSLETEVDAESEAVWSAEIRARLELVDAGTATTVPWSEARRRPERSEVDAPVMACSDDSLMVVVDDGRSPPLSVWD